VAKEIWDGGGTSFKTDIWALGMTVYRLMHGEDWYLDLAPDFMQVQKGGYAKKLPWLPHVPKDWRAFIRKCLNDDTDRRFQSARAVLSGLAKLSVNPTWECEPTDDDVKWSVVENGRRLEVGWVRNSGAWNAMSYPVGSGIKRTLGSSDLHRELERFFQQRAC
jgi:serine/threonine-protein kinase